MKKRLLGILLSFALMLTMMPGMSLTALAWEGDPYASLVNTTTVVKFDSKDWYLIENNSTAVNAGTVTLLSKECVAASQYDSTGSSNTYSGSTVETSVNNYYTNSISSNVKTAIVEDKMFLLTTDQADTIEQAKQEVLKCNKASGATDNRWWLCSPGSPDDFVFNAAWVDGDDGSVDGTGDDVSKTFGVRPALKLDLSKVVFDSTSKTFSIFKSYPLWVGGTQVTSANASNVLPGGDNDGKVVFTPADGTKPNTLTLKGVRITRGHMVGDYYSESGIYYNGSKPLNIDLADGSVNTVKIAGGTCNSQIGIYVDASPDTLPSLNISGKGQLTVSGSNYGINAPIITIDGCDVTASGGSGIHSYRGSIEIKGGSVYASATNYAIDAASSILHDVKIKAGSKVTASGGNKAIFGNVKNAIAGTGWEKADGSGKKTDIDTSDQGQKLTFKKVQFPVMFTVTFTDGQGKTLKTEEVASGKAATAPADPTRDGYTFKAWDKDFSKVTEDMTVTALWEKKADPAPASAPTVTTTAKSSTRTTTIKWTWNAVNGASKYKVAYHKVGSKKWKVKTTKKTKYVLKRQKIKGLYEYKVAAVTASGDVWSDTSCRYFKTVKTKAKFSKGALKVSWKKDKSASGYEVFIARNKKMDGAQVIQVAATDKSYSVTGLEKGRYYVKVRPMKNYNGVTYTGILCKAKKVRVK